jgi:hypothetical protein
VTVGDGNDEDIVEGESRRVVLEALTAAYQDVHAVLDEREPSAHRLSRTYEKSGVALRPVGSSGGKALEAGDSWRGYARGSTSVPRIPLPAGSAVLVGCARRWLWCAGRGLDYGEDPAT